MKLINSRHARRFGVPLASASNQTNRPTNRSHVSTCAHSSPTKSGFSSISLNASNGPRTSLDAQSAGGIVASNTRRERRRLLQRPRLRESHAVDRRVQRAHRQRDRPRPHDRPRDRRARRRDHQPPRDDLRREREEIEAREHGRMHRVRHRVRIDRRARRRASPIRARGARRRGARRRGARHRTRRARSRARAVAPSRRRARRGGPFSWRFIVPLCVSLTHT